MGFNIPQYMKDYLSAAKSAKPFNTFVNSGNYYSKLNWQWTTYMQTIVRPCIGYATNTWNTEYANNALSTATGMAILKGATRLIAGDKQFFVGNDESAKFLSDIWAPYINFSKFKERAVSFAEMAGFSFIKYNKDQMGRSSLSAIRCDRTTFTLNESGEVCNIICYLSTFTKTTNDGQNNYWLVEERKYNAAGNPVIIYKVFVNGSTVNSPVLPPADGNGMRFENIPQHIAREIKAMGITKLNTEIPLPTYDGLGVWLLSTSGTNSCVPDAPFGDPLLYGCADILWSLDVVFSGSMIDVINGEGKIIVPKQFLQETLGKLQAQYPKQNFMVTTDEIKGYGDETFVYVMPTNFDRDKMSPTVVQFDIRADQYGKMLEMYERLAAVRAGFSPSSIFPYLTQDASVKTAQEVTAQENLTASSVRATHNVMLPVFNRALREVLKQEGFSPDIQLQLGDYIGNKLRFDENVRANFAARLIPQEEAVKVVNNLTDSETQEWMQKIKAEEAAQQQFTEESFLRYQYDHSEPTAELASDSFGGSGNTNSEGDER